MKTTWFDIGYDHGLAEQEPAFPENSYARNSYREGYQAGEWELICRNNGWKVTPRERAKQAAGYAI